jgi:hypothetical protein
MCKAVSGVAQKFDALHQEALVLLKMADDVFFSFKNLASTGSPLSTPLYS